MNDHLGKTIEEIARAINRSTADILNTLQNAGIFNKRASDYISASELKVLLHGTVKNQPQSRITNENLTFRTSTGIKKNVGIQIKRKHTSPDPQQVTEKLISHAQESVSLGEKPSEVISQSETVTQLDNQVSSITPATPPPTNQLNHVNNTPIEIIDKESKKKKNKVKIARPPKKLAELKYSLLYETDDTVTQIDPLRQELSLSDEVSDKRKKRRDAQKRHFDVTSIHNQTFTKPTSIQIKNISVYTKNKIATISRLLSIKQTDVEKTLLSLGFVLPENKELDTETASLLIEELGHKVTFVKDSTYEELINSKIVNDNLLVAKPPIVSVMGHVDHGKTSLLDYIRKANQVSKEAGGITQHLGAYQVVHKNNPITFLDTPGHSAFTAMRSVGSKVTDIIVLVVAGDDGVSQQTIEVIQLAKDNAVPIVVAVNKCDKEEYRFDKVEQQLMTHNIIPDTYGGDTQFVKVSALHGTGIDSLLDAIILQSELLELRAPANGVAQLTVIESHIEKSIGVATTAIIQSGELSIGDLLVCGNTFGKVRILKDTFGRVIKNAQPCCPVLLFGLPETPLPGSKAFVVNDEQTAKLFIRAYEFEQKNEIQKEIDQVVENEDPFANLLLKPETIHHLIIKTDVQGTRDAIQKILTEDPLLTSKIKIIFSKVGPVLESDIKLANATSAKIIAFNVRIDSSAKAIAQRFGIEVKYYNVIYHILEDIKQFITNNQPVERREEIVGFAEVRNVFESAKYGQVAGCMVKEGVVKRKLPIRVLRNNVVIYEGELESLRRFKEDIEEVKTGIECGIAVKRYNDVQVGDVIEVFNILKK
ncbi:MAG: translation initiation factor IF-2 [Methylacidiphilales bacterium]|nr:translation initiation factor IF-2 [Candidatus Methylacidiphilales bacterium]